MYKRVLGCIKQIKARAAAHEEVDIPTTPGPGNSPRNRSSLHRFASAPSGMLEPSEDRPLTRMASESVISESSRSQDVVSMSNMIFEHINEAVRYQELGRLERLLEDGFDVAMQSADRHELLKVAVETGNVKVVRFLLDKGVYAKDFDWDVELLENAIQSGERGMVQIIVGLVGPRVISANLYLALDEERLDFLQELCAEGVEIDYQDELGESALHEAAHLHKPEFAEYLIGKGAKINLETKRRRTPLHFAVRNLWNWRVIQALLQSGANLEVKDCKGCTPFHAAIDYWNTGDWKNSESSNEAIGDARIKGLTLLLRRGANVNTANAKGNSPLHTAVRYKPLALVEFLLSRGADVDAVGVEGRTPLHEAALAKHSKSMALLLSQGANPNILDHQGCFPLHIAAYVGSLEMVDMLLQHGALIDSFSEDEDGKYHQIDGH